MKKLFKTLLQAYLMYRMKDRVSLSKRNYFRRG